MPTFPSLGSGAVAQYPLPASYTLPVQTVRFLDGGDQRFLSRGKALRTWRIQLSFLNEQEVWQIEEFFESLQGQYSGFSFPDPYSGQVVPNCHLGQPSLVSDYLDVDLASASLWVVESNG